MAPANAAVLWSEDFEGMTAGSLPPVQAPPGTIGINSVTSNVSGTRRTMVTDSATSPIDPFGGTGNQSLMFEKTGTGAGTSPNVYFTTPEATLGILTFDLYTVNSGTLTTPVFTLYTYDGGNSGQIGTFLIFSASNVTAVPSGGAKTVSNVLSTGVTQQVSLHFLANQTYSVAINGTPLSFSGTTWLPYYSATAFSIDRIRIGSQDDANYRSQVFVDNFVLVPEPGTCVLLGLAGMAFLLNRRKRRRAD